MYSKAFATDGFKTLTVRKRAFEKCLEMDVLVLELSFCLAVISQSIAVIVALYLRFQGLARRLLASQLLALSGNVVWCYARQVRVMGLSINVY